MAAKLNNDAARFALAAILLQRKPDDQDAQEMVAALATRGHPEAIILRALHLARGGQEHDHEYEEIRDALTRVAREGSVEAEGLLAILHLRQAATDNLKDLRAAAKKGSFSAQWDLGRRLMLGGDAVAGLAWLETAADQVFEDAVTELVKSAATTQKQDLLQASRRKSEYIEEMLNTTNSPVIVGAAWCRQNQSLAYSCVVRAAMDDFLCRNLFPNLITQEQWRAGVAYANCRRNRLLQDIDDLAPYVLSSN